MKEIAASVEQYCLQCVNWLALICYACVKWFIEWKRLPPVPDSTAYRTCWKWDINDIVIRRVYHIYHAPPSQYWHSLICLSPLSKNLPHYSALFVFRYDTVVSKADMMQTFLPAFESVVGKAGIRGTTYY